MPARCWRKDATQNTARNSARPLTARSTSFSASCATWRRGRAGPTETAPWENSHESGRPCSFRARRKRQMSATTFDTVIISDLHLGSRLSRAADAVEMLQERTFRRLILLGDIFCDLNFARL